MILSPDITTSVEKAVSGTHIEFGTTMKAGSIWMFVCSTACWIKQGASAALASSPATAATGSMFVPATVTIYIDGACGADLSVIQDAAAGKASLTLARRT